MPYIWSFSVQIFFSPSLQYYIWGIFCMWTELVNSLYGCQKFLNFWQQLRWSTLILILKNYLKVLSPLFSTFSYIYYMLVPLFLDKTVYIWESEPNIRVRRNITRQHGLKLRESSVEHTFWTSIKSCCFAFQLLFQDVCYIYNYRSS